MATDVINQFHKYADVSGESRELYAKFAIIVSR
jgi:hypothetical protein